LAEQLVQDRVLQAQEKNLALTFEGSTDLPLVQADAGLLEQVMSILLTNAINYTLPGGQITISTHYDDHQIGFKVRDTGLGILPEECPHLFDRFFQGAANREAKVRGTGLGLAIAKEIIDLHQGRIDVESTGIPGEGSTFSVWLNYAISPTAVDQ
jgi:signal transduction histidine kinase